MSDNGEFPKVVIRDNSIIASPLDGLDKLILLVLNRRIGQNDVCWMGQGTLAKESGLSLSTVKRRIRKLVELEVLICHGEHANPNGSPTLEYSINLNKLGHLISEANREQRSQIPRTISSRCCW